MSKSFFDLVTRAHGLTEWSLGLGRPTVCPLLSYELKEEMDEDEDEHGLQEAGAGLFRTRSHHKILRRRAQTSLALSSLNNSPDQAGDKLYQLLWNMIILSFIRDSGLRLQMSQNLTITGQAA